MWDTVKMYLLQIGLKKYLPMAVMGGMAALGTFLAAHAGVLEQYGVTYGTWPLQWAPADIPSGHVILIELDTLSASVIVMLGSLVTVLIRAAQHHTTGSPVIPPAATPPQEAK